MALVKTLDQVALDHISEHSEVKCTYSILIDETGRKCLQIDTYGSTDRQLVGKKSQSLRLAPEAIEKLKEILSKNGF